MHSYRKSGTTTCHSVSSSRSSVQNTTTSRSTCRRARSRSSRSLPSWAKCTKRWRRWGHPFPPRLASDRSLLTQVSEARHAYTLLEEGLQRHDAELSQERNDNQSSREQLEKLRLERDQLQEQLSQIQMEKQSVLAQLEQMRLSHAQMEERIKRLEERLMQEQQD